jgi:hypothetical protein
MDGVEDVGLQHVLREHAWVRLYGHFHVKIVHVVTAALLVSALYKGFSLNGRGITGWLHSGFSV